MKTHKLFSGTSVALVAASFALVACATANEEPAPVTAFAPDASHDTSNGDASDAMQEAATDSATPDGASPAKDASLDGATCSYPKTETRACGYCGSQSRFCLAEGVFTDWTDCVGERADAECKVGEKRSSDCGNCGKVTDYCDPKACTWISGLCTGEGPCSPGDTDTTKASCSDPTAVRTRTCDTTCNWSDFSDCAAPTGWLPMASAPIGGRIMHTAVWTGSLMLVWGGAATSASYRNDGASYDLGSNTWTIMPSSPLSARRQQIGVWAGSKLFIWGGYDGSPKNDGALYDPATSTWTSIPNGPLSARHSAAAMYSAATNEVIVWGGCTSGYCSATAADGAAYNLTTNSWSTLPASPLGSRADAAFGRINGELVIWGGRKDATTMLTDGARFDPTSRAWTKFSDPAASVLDGRYDEAVRVADGGLVIWGGRSTSTETSAKANGAIYTPMVGWTAIPAASDTLFAPSGKRFDVAAWVGSGKLYLFGGIPSTTTDAPKSGFVSYDLATGNWAAESTTGALGARARASVVWTGKEALIWGGADSNIYSPYYTTGAVFRP